MEVQREVQVRKLFYFPLWEGSLVLEYTYRLEVELWGQADDFHLSDPSFLCLGTGEHSGVLVRKELG